MARGTSPKKSVSRPLKAELPISWRARAVRRLPNERIMSYKGPLLVVGLPLTPLLIRDTLPVMRGDHVTHTSNHIPESPRPNGSEPEFGRTVRPSRPGRSARAPAGPGPG
jgi:hypothetical protein